jgi:hypothetical protein
MLLEGWCLSTLRRRGIIWCVCLVTLPCCDYVSYAAVPAGLGCLLPPASLLAPSARPAHQVPFNTRPQLLWQRLLRPRQVSPDRVLKLDLLGLACQHTASRQQGSKLESKIPRIISCLCTITEATIQQSFLHPPIVLLVLVSIINPWMCHRRVLSFPTHLQKLPFLADSSACAGQPGARLTHVALLPAELAPTWVPGYLPPRHSGPPTPATTPLQLTPHVSIVGVLPPGALPMLSPMAGVPGAYLTGVPQNVPPGMQAVHPAVQGAVTPYHSTYQAAAAGGITALGGMTGAGAVPSGAPFQIESGLAEALEEVAAAAAEASSKARQQQPSPSSEGALQNQGRAGDEQRQRRSSSSPSGVDHPGQSQGQGQSNKARASGESSVPATASGGQKAGAALGSAPSLAGDLLDALPPALPPPDAPVPFRGKECWY